MVHEIRVTPSILTVELSELETEIKRISPVSDYIHLDIMDNIFVPRFTFDFDSAQQIISYSPAPIDAHLMVANVDEIAVEFARIGTASVSIHAEATRDISSTLKAIRSHGARASLALKPATQFESVREYLDDADMFLVMCVEPGAGGQKFMADQLEKVRQVRLAIGDRPIWLQVDGGISVDTIELAREAGADTFVAGSAVFNAPDPLAMVATLRKLASNL